MVNMPREAREDGAAAPEQRSHLRTIRTLLPYLWQKSFEMRRGLNRAVDYSYFHPYHGKALPAVAD